MTVARPPQEPIHSACAVIDTPIGHLRLAATTLGLSAIDFDANPALAPAGSDPAAESIIRRTAEELDRYFKGELTEFSVPLAPRGTEFQKRVWDRLRQIPFGTTTTYGSIARDLGDPNATRAVGLANGRNPIPIIVPCHRVIGADGSLTGFGGGLPRKRWLLDHESRVSSEPGRADSLLFDVSQT